MPTTTKKPVNPALLMTDYFDYVEQYRAAATLLGDTADIFWPRIHMQGLLVELSLKAYLCSAGIVTEGHDLIVLAADAEKSGLMLTAVDREQRIANINKLYFRYLDWSAKYLSRYPMPDRGLGVWITPRHSALDEMIGRIVQQTKDRWKARQGAA